MLWAMRSLLAATLLALLTLPLNAWAQHDGPPPLDTEEDGEEDEPLRDENGNEVEIIESPFAAEEKACIEEHDGAACFSAGQKWFTGEGLERANITQAVELFEAGCIFQHVEACMAAAVLFKEGKAGIFLNSETGQVSIDLTSAEKYYRAACEVGRLEACGLAGELLMAPRKHVPAGATWHDLEEDLFSGRQSFEVGCPALTDSAPVWQERDARSCARLAQMWEEGHGVRRNRALATDYWDLACAAEDGKGNSCEQAQRIRALPAEPVEEKRVSVQPRRPHPKVDRFRDTDVGITGKTTEDHWRRFEIEGGVGARVRYPNPTLVMFKFRAGMAIWFNIVGIGFQTAFSTDKFAAVQERLITRFQHAISLKMAVPIPAKIPWGAVMRLGWGVGSTLGSVKYHPAPYALGYGIREYVQLEIGSGQTSGPRQWGAVRIEQQQTWHKGGGSSPEHSTQFVLIAGFTFAGKGPDWTPKKHVD